MRDRISFLRRASLLAAGLIVSFGVCVLTNSVAAADLTIHGVVTDDNGKPIRGSVVKATHESNSVARFTEASGPNEISGLHVGSYDVSVMAWGFGPKNEKIKAGQADSANFS